MNASSQYLKPLELPSDLQILLSQMITTDKNVQILHPLLDLLTRPEDQKESLAERLAFLLTALTEALRSSSTQAQEVATELARIRQVMETHLAEMRDRQNQIHAQLTKISNLLNLPVP